MRKTIRVSCAQICAGDSVEANLKQAMRFLQIARRKGAELVCFPEGFSYRGSAEALPKIAERIPGSITQFFQAQAKKYHLYLLLGSLVEKSARKDRYFNTSVLIGPTGRMLATYRK